MGILVWLLLVPLAGVGAVLLGTPRGRPQAAGVIAVASLVGAGLVAGLLGQFAYGSGAVQCVVGGAAESGWLPAFGVRFELGVDAISLWLIVLTGLLTPISILASWRYIKERQREFYAWMLVLHAAMLGVFCARDILLFYMFFEFTLVPMFFIIGIWGGADRRKAAGKFFLFTFAGSVLTLVSLLYLSYVYSAGYAAVDGVSGQVVHYVPAAHHMSFAITDLYAVGRALPFKVQAVLFLGLLAGFAVKVPLFPVHTWLPLAHTEAPTAGSVILAGVLLKLGTYGLLRFAVPMLPEATRYFAPGIAGICIIGIIYGALVSWVQGDMKKLIAYSSVSHLGFACWGCLR